MSTLCLTMIVKNEAHILPRLFESVRPWIDAWAIIDTGSTDDTQEVITLELATIPGMLLHNEWVDFAHNRTLAVKAGQDMNCDYLLLLDADHVLDVPDETAFDDLSADSYLIELLDHDLRYKMPYLVKADKPWYYTSPTHEFITCDEPFISAVHPTLSIIHHSDGGTRPEKFTRDLSLLERAYQENPTNERTCFYLAQTYTGLGRKDDAVHMYKERFNLGGFEEECYISLLRVANITGDTDDFIRAHAYRPFRPEAICKLAERFSTVGAHHLALKVIDQWSGAPSKDILFVDRGPEEYAIEFQKALALWWVGRHIEAREIWCDLLSRELPDNYRESILSNLKFYNNE